MAEITVHLTAQGRVQGVGFRYSVSQLAIRHHLTGFARNEVNGDVTIVLRGRQAWLSW
ncbi:acylphosphatase [Furfurilactobacillus sp. WILCCON 0119]